MRLVALVTLVLLATAACGGGGSGGGSGSASRGRDSLTERQRDSMLAKSRIPGASGVGKAMTVADSTSARVQAADTVQ